VALRLVGPSGRPPFADGFHGVSAEPTFLLSVVRHRRRLPARTTGAATGTVCLV